MPQLAHFLARLPLVLYRQSQFGCFLLHHFGLHDQYGAFAVLQTVLAHTVKVECLFKSRTCDESIRDSSKLVGICTNKLPDGMTVISCNIATRYTQIRQKRLNKRQYESTESEIRQRKLKGETRLPFRTVSLT